MRRRLTPDAGVNPNIKLADRQRHNPGGNPRSSRIMDTKRKYIALLGIISLLIAPAGASCLAADQTAGEPQLDPPGLLLAAGSSLLATGNPQPAAASDPHPPAPELIADESRFEFGRVLEGTEVVHDFLIQNRGSGDLYIDQVNTG